MALNFQTPPPEAAPAAPAPPADGSDLDTILRQFEEAVASERTIERVPPEPRVVAVDGLIEAPTIPAYDSPKAMDVTAKMDELARREAALVEKEKRMSEDRDRAAAARNDLDAAAAAVHNVNDTPVRPRRPRPEEVVAMNDNQHREYMRLVNLNTWGDLG